MSFLTGRIRRFAGGLAAEPQWPPGPGQGQLLGATQAEFVICDQTIETFFSDQKSRGFQIDRSHLSDPERVHRLLLAASLAYLWVICLGTVAHDDDWLPVIHRRHRCDLSLFQLGLRLLDYLLNHDQPIPSSFAIEPETVR